MRLLFLCFISTMLFTACDPCLEGEKLDEAIAKHLSSSLRQTTAQKIQGEATVTFTNSSELYSISIVKVGLSVKAFGFGEPSNISRNDSFIIPPRRSVDRTYGLDLGTVVKSAFAIKRGITMCEEE